MASPPTSLLDDWLSTGQEVLLPESGLWARLRPPTPEQLIRRGLLPRRLMQAALRAGPEATDMKIAALAASESEEDQKASIEENETLVDEMIRLTVRALRRTREAAWEPVSLSIDDVHQLPVADREALAAIVEYRTKPGMVTAYSLLQRGEISEAEALAMREDEAEKVIEAWEPFRDWTGIPLVRPRRAGVERPTQLPDRGQRSRRRRSA